MRLIYVSAFLITLCLPQLAQAEYDKPYVGDMIEYDTRYEDTFVHIARDFHRIACGKPVC